jgi:hypothetical protein
MPYRVRAIKDTRPLGWKVESLKGEGWKEEKMALLLPLVYRRGVLVSANKGNKWCLTPKATKEGG